MKDLLRILVSPLVWLASFSAVYALHGLVCQLDPGPSGLFGVSWGRITLGVAFVLAVLVQAGLLALLYSPRFGAAPGFARSVSRMSGWVGLAAALWTLFPTLVISSCGW
ncbi:hypothetical protein [Hoeflea ulvae]|uniref:Uncharacterized protein n=1 Tax=Hoeflea ulvae TaxID=2983764 RepID=A0ABT3YM63_9HYPH|nr:hypothetical protein [Hoeflea ulvae]MCY0096994.1 hypothetical protein [Hoeflea ulvae]